jgi:hypothetical protein
MPGRSDEQLLTYAELGERPGIPPDGAPMRARRKSWRHERNDPSGPMRVRAPISALPAHAPERSPEKRSNAPGIRAEMVRAAGVEAELRGELASARERAAVAEAVIEAERAAAEDRAPARNAVIEEMRAELARLRLPWWRRMAG